MRIMSRRAGALLFAMAVAVPLVSPSPANAASSAPEHLTTRTYSPTSTTAALGDCPTDPNIRWRNSALGTQAGVMYTIISATPMFYASDGRSVDNLLDWPISATFTSNQTRTTTVTATVGSTVQLTEKLQATVSVSIQIQRSTAIGVNATVDIPARTRVTGTYGLEGFEVVYDSTTLLKIGSTCVPTQTVRATTNAPTIVEGWHFTSTPV
jgi:hypothetical protein